MDEFQNERPLTIRTSTPSIPALEGSNLHVRKMNDKSTGIDSLPCAAASDEVSLKEGYASLHTARTLHMMTIIYV